MAGEDKLRDYLKRVTVDLAEARRKLADAEARRYEPIAIVGMACRYPGADSVDDFWASLAAGRCAVIDDVPGSRYDLGPYEENCGVYTRRGAFLSDIAGWDARFFGSSAREALRMDPHQRLLMELFWEAMEDAGTPPPSLAGSRTAVLVGFSDPFQYGRIQTEREGVRFAVDPYAAQGSSMSVVAGRLAYHFDLRGPTLALDTACSSSLVAVHQAGEALRRGECDLALAGAASLIIHPDMYVNGCSTSMFAPDGLCKTFDASADGYALGEGGGVVVLERLSDALRAGHRIHAVIRGSAVNQDGRSNGLTAPNRAAQVDVIRRAQAAARVTPDEVVYVEAHGSGTKLGDAIELGALGDVFGARSPERPLHVGAVKSNIGHTQAAAGMAGLIKTTLVLKRGVVPPIVNITELSETALAAGDIRPATAAVPLPLPSGEGGCVVGVSSFGWSGTNAHVVLEAAPAAELETAPAAHFEAREERSECAGARLELLPVSAADEGALRQHLAQLAGSIGESALIDVAFTLQSGRAEHEYRRAIIAADGAQAAARLSEASALRGVRRPKDTPRVAFLLPDVGDVGNGGGYGGGNGDSDGDVSSALGVELYGSDPMFAGVVDECVALVAERIGVELRPHFAGGADVVDGGADVVDGGAKRLLVFVVEYALARALELRGVTPHLVLGTGIGALVAGCLTGEQSLEDALRGAFEARDSAPGRTLGEVDWSHEAERIAANAQVCIELGPGGEGARALISGADTAQGPIVFNALAQAGESEAARLLTILGRLWELGIALDWNAVRGGGSGRGGRRGQIVPLPAYPFQRQRFWPEPAEKSTAQQRQEQSGDGAAEHVELLERRWTESAIQSASTLSGRFVLLADTGGIADALAKQLRSEGAEVVVARSRSAEEPAEEEPAAEEPADEALRDVDGTLTIVDLASVEERDELAAVLAASRSLARWGSLGAQGVRVLLATRGGQEVLGGEQADPAQAAVAALPVVAAQEYLSLDVRCVDLDPASSAAGAAEAAEAAQAADALFTELRAPAADVLVAYRAGARYASGYATASADDAADSRDARVVLPGGTYLITGGLGDIGLTLAEHLVCSGAGAVVLSSRGGVPDDPSDPRRAAVDRLRELGAQVHAPRADVTDVEAMRALFAEFRIDGVIHAAAQTAPEAFRPLADQDEAGVSSHLHAKVGGAKVLARVFAELPEERAPRWCHVFSSTSALLGGVTFGGYAAANAALAAVASQAQGGPVRWISAAWDTWACTLSRIAGGAIGASLVAHSMSDEEAVAAFDRSIGCGRASVVIAAGGLTDRLPRARVATPVESAVALVAPGIRFARPELPHPYTPPVTATERELAEVWAGVLGVEPVGTRDNFFDLGGNSLLVPQMLGLLKQRFGVSLPTVTVFEAPSVRALGAVIDGQGGTGRSVGEGSEVCPVERDTLRESVAEVCLVERDTSRQLVTEVCPAERDSSRQQVAEVCLVERDSSRQQVTDACPVERDTLRESVAEVCPVERDSSAAIVAESEPDRRIAIVGMSGRFPGAGDVGEFWRNLCEGVESITFFSPEELIEAGVEPETLRDPAYVPARAILDDIAGFDAGFFGISPRMAALTDPQQRLFLEVCWEALEQAGYCRSEHRGRVGVYGGTHISTYLLGIRDRLGDDVSQFEIAMGNEKDALATTVSYLFDLHGPSVAVQTFCSTSLVATHLAVRALRDGDCEMALAGGVSIRVPDKRGHRYEEGGMESPDGHVRTFDAKARGAMFGDGAAVVLLKRLSDALRDGDHVWGVIRGSAMNNDGGLKVGYTAPSLVGQAKVVAEAMADAGVRAEQVGYVEAHGSGTRLGDPIEVAALTRAFGPTPTRQYCPIGSVKTNVGHLDRAAGAAGLIKATLAVREGLIPPTLHFTAPNPEIDFANSPFYVNNRLQTWAAPAGEPRIAGLNSLGMGGTNVHVVVEEPPRRPASRPQDPATSRRFQVLPVSARSAAAADDSCQRLGDHLTAHPDTRLADVAYTLQVGRKTFEHRRAVVATQFGDAVNVLTRVDGAAPASRVEATQERPVAFLLAGVGEQYPGMVGELYRREPAFRARLDDCLSRIASALHAEGTPAPGVAVLTDLLAGPRGGTSLAALLGRATESDPRAEALQRTEIVQPLMFAVDYALAATLMDWGLRPAAMLGYSLGEYVAACLAGVLSLGDAIALVVHRATLISGVERGAMAAVSLSAEELRGRYRIQERGLDIAAVNGPQTVVVAGPSAAMDALLGELRQGEIACRPLQTTHAFHSRMLAQVAAPLTDWIAANISLNPPKLPYLSNVTGRQADPALVRDPAYWARHMCETVQFAAGADALLADPELALVEIGPGPSLGALLRAAGCPPQRWPLISTTLPAGTNPRPADETLADCLARLWLIGAEIDWTAYHGRHDGSAEVYAGAAPGRIPLPTYPFQRQKYWIEAGKPTVRAAALDALPAEGTGTLSDVGRIPRLPEEQWLHLPVWRQLPATPAAERQSGSWLVFARDGAAARVLAELRRAAAWSGADVTVVRPATAYAAGPDGYTLRPGSTDDALNLLRDLRAGAGWPERIVHLWTLDEPTAAETAAIAAAREDDDGGSGYRAEPGHDYEDAATVALGLHTLVSLARAAGELGMEGWALDIVTSGAHDVLGGGEVRPAAATLVGPALVIPLEYPTISTRLIDAEQRTDPAAIVAELRRTRTERTIALRGARRWACDYQSVTAPAIPAADTAGPEGTADVPSTALREGGVYLITGGLGGIGLAMAERLARACRAKLVLFGRSGLPPRERWEAIASGAEAVDESSRGRVARALEIVALGGEVEIVVGDITDPHDARRAVEQAQARFGALHGVLHAAGVPGIGLIQFKRPEDGELVLAPKVAGTRALARALRLGEPDEVRLDFLALFSSVTSATGGGPGQVDYCAANAFLDAFAAAWSTPDRRVLSVDWGEWVWNGWDEGLGGFDDGLRAFFREHRAAFGISFDEGWRTLLRALRSGEPRVFASTQDLSAMVRLSAGFTVDAALAPTGGQNADRHPRPDLVTPYQEPSGDTEEAIAALWAESLKLDRIGALDNFFELGGNSLLGINLLAALRRAFTEAELPPHILHQAPTVAALAEIVDAGTGGTAEPTPRDEDAQAQAQLRRSALKAAAARRRRR